MFMTHDLFMIYYKYLIIPLLWNQITVIYCWIAGSIGSELQWYKWRSNWPSKREHWLPWWWIQTKTF